MMLLVLHIHGALPNELLIPIKVTAADASASRKLVPQLKGAEATEEVYLAWMQVFLTLRLLV